MLSSEYSWLFDCDASQQLPDYLLDAGTYAHTDGGGISAVAQDPSSALATEMNSNQQPPWIDNTALSINQGIDFASLFTDANASALNPNLSPALVDQDAGSILAYQDIDAELFYRNAQSPSSHPHIDPAVVSQCKNQYDTSALLSTQDFPDPSLSKELDGWLLEETPYISDFAAGLVTDSETEFGNVDEGPRLDCEQPQQDWCNGLVTPLADTRERLNKQDERISELELALQQQTHPEFPQMLVSIP